MPFLDQLSEWRENNRLEFKSARGGFPRSFWETYSSFANTSGGLIVLGVEETPEGPKAVGVSDSGALIKNLWNGLNNPQRVSANLLLDSDIAIHQVDGVEIVAIKVPRADRTQRPVHINNSLNAGTYRRNGEGDYHCNMEVIRAMVRDSYDGALDRDVLDDIAIDALDMDSVRRYRNEFSSNRLKHPWIGLADEEFLLRLGAIGRSENDGKLHPTKAGLLMFGESWRIVDAFPNYFLDCRVISGARRWDDRITSDSGDWSGNVYDFWNRACRMLCEGLPRPFILRPNMTRDDDTPQHKAVREGLTNALVHADYYGRTGVVAVRRRSTVEFSDPGCLRLPVEVVEGGGVSDPRNKTLMTMFNLIGRGDKAGSGFDVFRDAAAYAGVAEPELVECLEPDRTKLTLHVEVDGTKLAYSGSVLFGKDDVVSNVGNADITEKIVGDVVSDNKDVVSNVVSSGGNVVSTVANRNEDDANDVVSNEGDHAVSAAVSAENVIRCIQADSRASASSIARDLNISSRQVQRYLRQLREAGRIERIGGTHGYWEVR